MAFDIGPRISIKGEKEFNEQIRGINSNLKLYKSEMNELTSRFDENADSQEALIQKNKVLTKSIEESKARTKAISDQIEKYNTLLAEQAQHIKSTTEEFGENSAEAEKATKAYKNTQTILTRLKTSLNDSTSSTNKFTNELETNNTKLQEMEDGSRDASTGLKKLGDTADATSNDVDDLGDVIKDTFSVEAISEFSKSAIESIKGVVDESKEFLKIMGSLNESSKLAGYSTEQTAETYNTLFGVLADDQTTATTTANLQALGLEQSQLNQMTLATIGAWAKYGDSIPIDSLSEAINETIQVGKVTGTFADVLNWAGTSEDDFNLKLEQCSNESERANLVLQEMARQGLVESANGWMANNKELVENNQAQAEFQRAMGELAKTMMPLMTEITNIMSSVLKLFNELPAPVQYAVVAILGLLAVLGSLAPIITAIGFASSGASLGVGALSASMLPIAGTVLGIIAVITALIVVIKNWGAISDWIGGKWNELKTWCSDLWNGITSSWNRGIENTKRKVDGWVNNVARSFSNMLNQCSDIVGDLINSAVNWGSDMMEGFADGIMSGFRWVKRKVKEVTGWIRSMLHFSVPDQGPLADADKWGPDFMQLIADGIEKNKGEVERQVMDIANMMKLEPSYSSSSKTISNSSVLVNSNLYLDGRVVYRNVENHAVQRQNAMSFVTGG